MAPSHFQVYGLAIEQMLFRTDEMKRARRGSADDDAVAVDLSNLASLEGQRFFRKVHGVILSTGTLDFRLATARERSNPSDENRFLSDTIHGVPGIKTVYIESRQPVQGSVSSARGAHARHPIARSDQRSEIIPYAP